VDAARATGIDGIFYAVQHAQRQFLGYEEYKGFGLAVDRVALEPAQGLWCNMLHLHGEEIHFELANDLPFQIVNWHDRESHPSLTEAQSLFNGVVCGGMRQDTLVYRDQAEVRNEAADALKQTNGKRFLLGTGCVVPVIASHGNILAARKSVE
jgi:uroporphyrinogen decarboxylase